ncbi:MAG: ATP-binding protein [Pseudomonadota bacterium]
MENHEIAITVKNKIKELDRISEALDAIPASVCPSSKKRCEINLIVEELFTNIVSHGIDDGREHDIDIRFSWTDTDLTIRIEDDGKPFNPITVEVPDTTCCLNNRCIGGLGIHLVRHFMDAFNYVRKKGKNIMILKKILSDAPHGGFDEPGSIDNRTCEGPLNDKKE